MAVNGKDILALTTLSGCLKGINAINGVKGFKVTALKYLKSYYLCEICSLAN